MLDKSHLTVLAVYRHNLDMCHACHESSLKVALASSPSMAFQLCCCGPCATLEVATKLLLSACASVLHNVMHVLITKLRVSYRTDVILS